MSRLLVRAALLWLGVGFSMGALLLAAKAGAAPAPLWALREPHIHVLLAGWMVQLGLGVAHWILPRHSAAGNRGSPLPVAVAAVCLNLAALVALAGAIAGVWGQPAGRALAGLTVPLEVAAFALAAWSGWGRAIPFRALPRPGRASGEQP